MSPCSDNRPPDWQERDALRNHKLMTQLLCEAMNAIEALLKQLEEKGVSGEQAGVVFSEPLKAWWAEHWRLDQRRKLRDKTLAKLTPAERAALSGPWYP